MKELNTKRIGVVLLALLIVVGGAAAYTTVFSAGAGTTYETDSGPTVSTSTTHGLDTSNPFIDSNTVYIDGVTITSQDNLAVTVDQFRGQYTNLSSITAYIVVQPSGDKYGEPLTVDPDDKSAVIIEDEVTALSWEDSALDGTAQMTYSAEGGGGVITATGLPANTEYVAAKTDGTILTSGTTNSDGNATINVDAATDEQIVLLEPTAPVIDETSADPPDGADLSENTNTFEINISDADFTTDAGDTVTAELFVDGSKVGEDTLTSDGTASVTTTISDGGEHQYHWEATDAYGESVSSTTRTISTPATLKLRDETNPDSLVTDAKINITAYYSGEVLRRNSTDGVIDLSGFPVDEPVTVRAQADGYYSRTTVIESIYDQANVYMLNKSTSGYSVRFKLTQTTGEYPAEDTVLFVERDIELNDTVEWRTIAGDNFGVVGVPVDLVGDERYRLRIKNLETGQTTVLGKYTAVQSETVTLSPGAASIDITDSTKAYGWSVTQNDTAQTLLFEYLDSESSTNSVTLTVHERYNKSNVLIDNQTFTSNELLYQYDMTPNETNTTWMAEIYVDRGNGTMHFREPVTGPGTSIIPTNLAQVWKTSMPVFLLLIVGMAFSMLHVGVGAIATSLIGALLWYVGLLAGVATGPSVALAIVVSVLYHYYEGGGY